MAFQSRARRLVGIAVVLLAAGFWFASTESAPPPLETSADALYLWSLPSKQLAAGCYVAQWTFARQDQATDGEASLVVGRNEQTRAVWTANARLACPIGERYGLLVGSTSKPPADPSKSRPRCSRMTIS